MPINLCLLQRVFLAQRFVDSPSQIQFPRNMSIGKSVPLTRTAAHTRALVVGNGIIGLTTAAELRRRGVQVVVVTAARQRRKRFDPNFVSRTPEVTADITALQDRTDASCVAGGWWFPYKCQPAEKVDGWSLRTLMRFRGQLAAAEAALRGAKGRTNTTSSTSMGGSLSDDAELGFAIEEVPSALASTQPFREDEPPPSWTTAKEFQAVHQYERLPTAQAERALSRMFARRAEKMRAQLVVGEKASATGSATEALHEAIQAHALFTPAFPLQVKSASVFLSVTADAPTYLDLLERQLQRGEDCVEFVYETRGGVFGSAADVAAFARQAHCSIVVNCAGLAGARFRAAQGGETGGAGGPKWEEDVMIGGRGVLSAFKRPVSHEVEVEVAVGTRVRRRIYLPACSWKVSAEDGEDVLDGGSYAINDAQPAYLIPRGGLVVSGGAYDERQISSSPAREQNPPGPVYLQAEPATDEERARLNAVARTFMPQIANDSTGRMEPAFSVAAFRPVRRGGVKVGSDVALSREHGLVWANNYGHGGAGWTTCWGCAEDVAEQVVASPGKS